MISSILTPFRWYNKYYQQNRWDIECKSVCDFKLITDQDHLLPFQIKRATSPSLIIDWILRPCCVDTESPMLNNSESLFISGWDNSNGAWIIDECGGIIAITNSGEFEFSTICYNGLIVGQEYTVSFYIGDQSGGATTALQFYNGGTLIGSYTGDTGLVTITFTATATTFCFGFTTPTSGDILQINNVQIVQSYSHGLTDIILDESLLYQTTYEDFDIISYCGNKLNVNTSELIPPGCYYSIMQDEAGVLYYSEVITVKSFDPSKSPYFILEWYNDCDLSDVIYSGSNGCDYKNKLYLEEAVLTKPTYPFKEEGSEDGNQNFNPTFQKWQKIISLFGYKLPEFIVDALTGIRLHDNIKFYYPIRQKQLYLDAPVTVRSLEYDVQYVVDDCFANVELKMTLQDQFVDETCCNNLDSSCLGCEKTIPEVNVFDEEQYEWALIFNDDTDTYELYNYLDNAWVLVGSYIAGVWTSDVSEIGDLICDDSKGDLPEFGAWQIQNSNLVFCPVVTSGVFTTGQNWLFIGTLFYNTYGQIEYSTNGGSSWTALLPKFTQAQFASGVELTVGITCCCEFLVRVKMFTLTCEYGYSVNKSIICQTHNCC